MRVLREGLSLYRKRCAFRYLGRLDPPVGASAGIAPRGGRRARERRAVAGPPFEPTRDRTSFHAPDAPGGAEHQPGTSKLTTGERLAGKPASRFYEGGGSLHARGTAFGGM